jgi:hypothetical protein
MEESESISKSQSDPTMPISTEDWKFDVNMNYYASEFAF